MTAITKHSTPGSQTPQPPTSQPAKNLGGRPTQYSEAIVRQICQSIEEHGWSPSFAGLMLRIHPKTLASWKKRHPAFDLELQAARAIFLAGQLRAMGFTSESDKPAHWRARAWMLERMFPEEYGRRGVLKVEATVAPPPVSPRPQPARGIVITPAHLRGLQQRRAEAMRKMNAERAAQSPSPAPAVAAPPAEPHPESGFSATKPYKPPGTPPPAAEPPPVKQYYRRADTWI